jgi:hypothetical protein
MTTGFIDTASINSAAGLLSAASSDTWSEWDKESLFDVTYLLMHSNIKVVPTMDKPRGATSYYQYVLSKFPQLSYFRPETQNKAKTKAKAWLSRNISKVAEAWKESNKNKEFTLWANVHREQAFVRHVERHGSLFESAFIPYISKVLKYPEGKLHEINSNSANLDTVARWSKSSRESEIQLPQNAWMLAGMMRGKYHEYLAREENLQLLQHPFRKGIGARLKTGSPEPVTNSESYFINIVIASALVERKPDNRVLAWLDNIDNARSAILRPTIALPFCNEESQAEKFAFEAAKKIGIPSRSMTFRRVLDWTFSVSLGTSIAYTIAPWIWPLGTLASPSIQAAYKHIRGANFGDDISRHVLFTKQRFQKLQRTVAGRIEHVPLLRA